MNYSKLARYILNFLFPETCLSCKKDLNLDEKILCNTCKDKLFEITHPYCKRCGIYLDSGGEYCYNCRKKKYHFEFVRSVFMYNDIIASVIYSYKYRKNDWLSDYIADVMYCKYFDYPEFGDYGYITYVPVDLIKYRERGFNQSYLIAKKLAEKLDLGFIENVAVKKIRKSQVGLSAYERAENIKNSFYVKNNDKLISKKIIIVDDVATTLSTVNELSKVFTESGAEKISVFTLARE